MTEPECAPVSFDPGHMFLLLTTVPATAGQLLAAGLCSRTAGVQDLEGRCGHLHSKVRLVSGRERLLALEAGGLSLGPQADEVGT